MLVVAMPLSVSAKLPTVKITPAKKIWRVYSNTATITGRVSYSGGQVIVMYNSKGKPVDYQKMSNTGRAASFSLTTSKLKKGKSAIFYIKSLKSRNASNSATKAVAVSYIEATSGGNSIAATAEKLAWPLGTPTSKFSRKAGGRGYGNWAKVYKKWRPSASSYSDPETRVGSCCCHAVSTVVMEATKRKVGNLLPNTSSAAAAKKELQNSVGKSYTILAYNGNPKMLKRGDILTYAGGSGGHVEIYLGNGKIAEASHTNGYYLRVTKQLEKSVAGKDYFYVIRKK